ncbi:MAG: nuclease [Proteobacteria bacterium]|nr:MAG: nuclease [Pseudomonadota bacterium]
MSTRQIHVFISHSWAYSNHYNTLANRIFNRNWRISQASLNFRNFSVPQSDPIHNDNNDTQLRNALYSQISRSHVVVIPTGMYSRYSKWIQKEIDGAVIYKKLILAVNPWGAQRTSADVKNAVDKVVEWNAKTVIGGIWELYK